MRVEVHSTQMACSIVTLIISLASLASFAICKEGLVRRRVDRHPNLTRLSVDAIGMATQFMFTPEAVGIVVTGRTLQSEYSSRG